MPVAEFVIVGSLYQEAAFMLPMIVMAGVMYLMMMLFAKKPDNGTIIDMNTPSIQLTRGGIVPIVHGFRRVGATFCWVGNRYTVEEPVESVGKSIIEGTLVESSEGAVPIESLMPGDRIWTRTKSGQRKLGRIKSMSDRMSDDLIRILHVGSDAFGGENQRVIEVTADHMMWVIGPKLDHVWVQARDIHPGDQFELFGGGKSTVRSVELIKTKKRVLCPRMGRFCQKNFFAGGICVHNLPDAEITQTAYFESSWHVLACGPVMMINGIWENGKKVAGPIYSDATPSGSTVSIGENSSFKVYWGFSDVFNSAPSTHGNCSSSNPAHEDPILRNFCQTGLPEDGKQSCWPNVCSVVWQTRRLGVYPRWPQVEYDIYSESSGGAQAYACGFDIEDSGYSDGGCSGNGPDTSECWGVNPAVSLFKILTGPYPTGLSIPGEWMDYHLFQEAAEYIRSNELWNSNILIQAGHKYHRVIGELLTDMGALLIERDGLIGPKIIRKGMDSDEPIPLLTGDILRPPLDEVARSHISSMNESIQFKYHQRSLNYRQNTIDIDNQESVADGEFRRKTTSAEMATVTSWYSATVVANRRSYESMVSGSTLTVSGDRGLRNLRPGELVDVANLGKYRITTMTPDFDSIGVKLELTLDPYSVGEITPWSPDDTTVEPPVITADPDISQDFLAKDMSAILGPDKYFVFPFLIRAHQAMTNHSVYFRDTTAGGDNILNVGSGKPCPGGVVIWAWDDLESNNPFYAARRWSTMENLEAAVTKPCVVAFYANGDQFSVPTDTSGYGPQHVMAAKVWGVGHQECDCQTVAEVQLEIASVTHFEDLDPLIHIERVTSGGPTVYEKAMEMYDANVAGGLLPPDMRLMVPVLVGRGIQHGISGFEEGVISDHQGSLRPSVGVENPSVPFTEMGSRFYVQRVSNLLSSAIDLEHMGQMMGMDAVDLWDPFLNRASWGFGLFKAVPCLGTDCVDFSAHQWSDGQQCGGEPYDPSCTVQGSYMCVDGDRVHSGDGGGFFTQYDVGGNLLNDGGDDRSSGVGNFETTNGMISGMRVGGLSGDYGSSTGVNIPTNGGLVEYTASSSTVDIPDQGFMGTLDGYYRIPQGDHTTTSSSAPTPQMIGIQWSYKDPEGSRGRLGSGGIDVSVPSDVYFKVRLQGAGILEDDVRRLPHIGEIPDYSSDLNEWKTWVDFERWRLGSSGFDHRMGMTSIVTFALPRAREKALLARYLNTDETQAVSVRIGLGGRSRVADVAAVKQPRCRFIIEYYRKGKVVGTSTAYVRAVGTDGATNFPSDDWW